MDISPDGSTLAITTADRIQRFDTKRLQPVGPAMRGHNGDIKDVEYSHDGSMLLSNSVDRSAIVWDTDNGAVLQRLSAHSDETWGGAFGPDDKTAYTVSGDEDLMSWDVTGARELWSTGKATDPSSVSRLGLPAPDGRTVARSDADRIWFVDNRTGRQTSKARTTSDVWTSTWSPDSHWLLTTGPGVLSLWDARNGGLVDERRYERGTAVLAVFSPDSEQIHVENGYGVVETLDRSTLRRIHPWMRLGGTVVMTLLAQPRDASVIAVRQDGSYVRFDPESHLILDSVEAGFLGRESEGAALSPDGSTLLTVRPDGLTGLLDLDTHTWLGEGFDTDKARDRCLRARRTSVRHRRSRSDQAVGRCHRCVSGQPAATHRHSRRVDVIPAGQRSPAGGVFRRAGLDRRHTARGLVRPRVRHRRTQPDPGRVVAVLPQPAVRDHLSTVARRPMTVVRRDARAPHISDITTLPMS